MFECHITTKPPGDQKDRYERVARYNGWKTSQIDGDPVLGKEVFFYFTCHGKIYQEVHDKMEELAGILGDAVVRKKIEQIVYDTKTGVAPSPNG